jgi:alkanesulfonate monooxygenase SsuD/methylene tetrahydromethanopterin reductase-like flavin-dependent oxidoreductase (luciferase family)
MAAVGEEAIKTAAKYTDGLITLAKPDKANETFEIFDEAAVKEGKDPNSRVFNLSISDPRELEQKAKEEVSDEKLRQSTPIVTSIEDFIKPLEEYFKACYTRLYAHTGHEIRFIQDFSKKVLPYFNDRSSR